MKQNFAKIPLFPAPIRLGIFIVMLLLIWLPGAIPLYFLCRSDPNLLTILVMGLLFIEYLFLLQFWSKNIYQESLLKRYGLTWRKRNFSFLIKGLSIGLFFVFIFFICQATLGWVVFQKPSTSFGRIIFEGLISALGIGLAEELFFRGWLLDELERDYPLKTALLLDGLIFALLHFLKPLEEIIRTFPQFPGLFLLGITLVFAKRSHGNNLGICLGLHGGLVWGYYIINVGQLIKYSGNINPWIVGVDQNPIAGLMGIIFLSFLLLLMNNFTIKIDKKARK